MRFRDSIDRLEREANMRFESVSSRGGQADELARFFGGSDDTKTSRASALADIRVAGQAMRLLVGSSPWRSLSSAPDRPRRLSGLQTRICPLGV